MRKLLSLTAVASALALLTAVPGHAQAPCLERPEMVDALIGQFGEQLAEVREVSGYGLLEFHVSPALGTWTILLTNEQDVSCVVAAGDGVNPENYEAVAPQFAI